MVRSVAYASVLGLIASSLWIFWGVALIYAGDAGKAAVTLWEESAYVLDPFAFARWRGHVFASSSGFLLTGVLYGASTALYLVVRRKLRASCEQM